MNKRAWKLAKASHKRFEGRFGGASSVDFLNGYARGYEQAEKEAKNRARRAMRFTSAKACDD